jgi:hypothetical protein
MFLRIVAVAICLAGLVWVIAGIRADSQLPEAPKVLGFGPEFTGSAQLPAATIQATYEAAHARMISANSSGRSYRIFGDVGVWLAFFASAAVTLILGWLGYAPANSVSLPDGASKPTALSVRATRWIGVLAAAAAVLTALGNLAQTYSQHEFDRTDQLQKLLMESRKEVLSAQDAQSAQAVLDNLELQSQRL